MERNRNGCYGEAVSAARQRNPFKPTFACRRRCRRGVDELVRDFSEALEIGPGAPARATTYTGARGTGKTVMLNAAQEAARTRGWLVVAETATPGLLNASPQNICPGCWPNRTRRRSRGRSPASQCPEASAAASPGIRPSSTQPCRVYAPKSLTCATSSPRRRRGW